MTPSEIRAIRLAVPMTQRELAERVGAKGAETVRAWESARRRPGAAFTRRLEELWRELGARAGTVPASRVPWCDFEALAAHAQVVESEAGALRERLAAWEAEGHRLLETGQLRRDTIAMLLGVVGEGQAARVPVVPSVTPTGAPSPCPTCDGSGWRCTPGEVRLSDGRRFSCPSWGPCKGCNPTGKRPIPPLQRD